MWLKKHKWKIILPVLVAAILAGVFYYGGGAPGARGWHVTDTPAPFSAVAAGVKEPARKVAGQDLRRDAAEAPPTEGSDRLAAEPDPTPDAENGAKATQIPEPSAALQTKAPEPIIEINPQTGKDKYLTDPVPQDKPAPVERQDAQNGSAAYTCTLSISCAAILENIDMCDPEKIELVPKDGWILSPTEVTFYEGESVFDVLRRTCKQLKIHMEYEDTPIYNSAYIEGIHNLYEFDVGELSGWMYKVNDWFPNYGCSRYQLRDKDVIEWVYTCDLGYDVGGGYAAGG